MHGPDIWSVYLTQELVVMSWQALVWFPGRWTAGVLEEALRLSD